MRRAWAAGLAALAASLGPAATRGASLTLETSPVVLGRVDSVGVLIRIEEPADDADRPLRLSVNVGSFGPVTRLEPGLYRAVYTPPPTRFPQVALVAAWREAGPEAPIEFLRIPLWGTTTIEALAPAGSEVHAEIGPARIGPVTTDAKGRAALKVDVPPGVPEAVIRVKDKTGMGLTRRAAVSVPPYNRLTVALVPHAVVADGTDWARLEVFYDVGGEVSPEKILLRASEGSVKLLSAKGGRFTYRYQPPPGTASREATFQVSVEGDPTARGTARLLLGLPPPAEVVVRPPAKPILADGRATAVVEVRVYDDKRLGLPHQRIELLANGQRIPEIEYSGGGVYRARYVAPAAFPEAGLVRLVATVIRPDGQPLTATANYRVLAPPIPSSVRAEVHPTPVLADGRSRAVLSFDVRDTAGAPLPGAQLIAIPSHGAVSPVLEVGQGQYRADFVAPDGAPPGREARVRLVDSSNRFEQVFAVALREPERLLLGARAGYVHNLDRFGAARAGLDLWLPFWLAGRSFAAGVTASASTARQRVAWGTAASESQATFFPVALRLAFAPYVSSRLALYLGAGPQLTWARVRNDAHGYAAAALGAGALGFAGASFSAGPGQLFGELGFSWAPVEHDDFRLDAGGVGLELGYRFGLF